VRPSKHDAGAMQISNQEYVQTIYGNDEAEALSSVTFSVNPGLVAVFPMLSQFAQNFELYEFLQCAFHYETLLDEGVFQSDTGQVGDILTYAHTNPDAADYETVSQFISGGGAVTRATKGVIAGVECSSQQMHGLNNAGINRVRSGPTPGDASDYDQAKFQLAVSSTPTSLAKKPIGRLYVSYTVKLIKPRLHSTLTRNQVADYFHGEAELESGSGPSVAQDEIIPRVPVSVQRPASNQLHEPKVGSDTDAAFLRSLWSRCNLCQMGCDLQPFDDKGTASGFRITFPNWLQGVVKLTYTMDLNAQGAVLGSGHRSLGEHGACPCFTHMHLDGAAKVVRTAPGGSTGSGYANPDNWPSVKIGFNNYIQDAQCNMIAERCSDYAIAGGGQNHAHESTSYVANGIFGVFIVYIRLSAPDQDDNSVTLYASAPAYDIAPFLGDIASQNTTQKNRDMDDTNMDFKLSLEMVTDHERVTQNLTSPQEWEYLQGLGDNNDPLVVI